VQAIAFPFRFRRGRAVSIDTATDQYAAQKILTAASTRVEELPLLPRFGTKAPEFATFDTGGLFYTTATYFPEINISDVRQGIDNSGVSNVTIAFDVLLEE
jgi:hypothetical protein